jgi:hypothetical protein
MYRHFAGAAAVAALLAAGLGPCGAAGADEGAAALVGKTCQGVFNNGKHQEVSRGALQLQFTGNGGQMAAHFWRSFGKPAHDKVEYAMTQHQFVGLDGFQDLGAVRELTVAGNQISFKDPVGVKFTLSYASGGLVGQGDPRGGSDPRMTVPSTVSMVCR